MKIGATKITEISETTRLFNAATAAVLSNIGNFCTIAVDAQNKQALLTLGRAAMQTINAAMERIENERNQTIN